MYVFYDKRRKIFWSIYVNLRKSSQYNKNIYIVNLQQKICKSWKKNQLKRKLLMFYIPVILIDSIYTKNENCYPKLFLEKIITFFGEF